MYHLNNNKSSSLENEKKSLNKENLLKPTTIKKQKIYPFVKWVGGKRQIQEIIKERLPSKMNVYYEPFVGGGALLFYLQPSRAIIADTNKELIEAYQTIKYSYQRLREYLLLMEYGHSEAFFYQIRNIDRNQYGGYEKLSLSDSKLLKTARFIYLNKACYNGLYRVNSNGLFNTPWNKEKIIKTHDYPNLHNIANYLKSNQIKIWNRDFAKTVINAKKGDFVYFDPPYDFEKDINGFTNYQKTGFSQVSQKRLAKVCKQLHNKGVNFLVSNHNTKLINKLYQDFKIEIIHVQRNVGGRGAKRKKVEEVIITNYETKRST